MVSSLLYVYSFEVNLQVMSYDQAKSFDMIYYFDEETQEGQRICLAQEFAYVL
ncbi:hypothetical protein Hdeb2414_s0071g00773891 [Helianthus debilis subsp. tardiflorus]